MTEPKRHVSRWHAATPIAAADSAAGVAVEAQPEVSLRYLNEFVGKLQCASALLGHKLYPDAKEITESMGVFNAVRKYVLQDDQEAAAEHFAALAASARDSTATPDPKADGIVVVGDGSTPRTAAMFAHRLRHWKGYSIDPAMEYRSSERSLGWETISNLVVIRNKIEKVRITLRRAIVVLVHAHVTLEQALSAVDAETIVGVVTLPCCNWFSKQEVLFGRHPDLVYDDFSILSDKREVRLWVGGERKATSSSEEASLPSGIVISDAEIKVCIPKTFRAGKEVEGVDQEGDSAVMTNLEAKDPSTKAAAEAKYAKVLGILKDLLLLAKSQQEPISTEQQQPRHTQLPVELKPRLTSDSHILVLDSRAAKVIASRLLQDGHRHVYILGEPTEILTRTTSPVGDETNAFQQEAITIPLIKLILDQSEMVVEELQGSVRIVTKELTLESLENEDDDVDSGFGVTFQSQVSSFERINCVVDNRFLYHGFRGESRNAALFRKLCSLVHRVAETARSKQDHQSKVDTLLGSPSLICVTPRRNWRKKDYLSHEVLRFEVQGVPVKQRLPESWELKDRSKRDQELTFIYCCRKIHRGDADRKQAAHELENQQSMKDTVLAMKQTMQENFDAVEKAITERSVPGMAIPELSVQQVIELAPQAAEIDPSIVTDRTYVQVLGEISNTRRYTKGMAFLSLAPPQFELEVDAESRNSEFDPRNPLQVFLQLQELNWSPELFRDVLLMLHTGDQVRVLGFLKKSERGTPVLSVAAISFVRGEFEAYA